MIEAVVWLIQSLIHVVLGAAMCGGFVMLVVWAFQNPDEFRLACIGDNSWIGCFSVFGIVLLVLAIAMGIGMITPLLICALVGWFCGKAIAKAIEWFFCA